MESITRWGKRCVFIAQDQSPCTWVVEEAGLFKSTDSLD